MTDFVVIVYYYYRCWFYTGLKDSGLISVVFPYYCIISTRIGVAFLSTGYMVIWTVSLDSSLHHFKLGPVNNVVEYKWLCTHCWFFFCTLCISTELMVLGHWALQCWWYFNTFWGVVVSLIYSDSLSYPSLMYSFTFRHVWNFPCTFWWLDTCTVTSRPRNIIRFCVFFI